MVPPRAPHNLTQDLMQETPLPQPPSVGQKGQQEQQEHHEQEQHMEETTEEEDAPAAAWEWESLDTNGSFL